MGNSSRGASVGRAAARAAAMIGVVMSIVDASAGDPGDHARALSALTATGQIAVETVYFKDPRQQPVRLLRGVPGPVRPVRAAAAPAPKPEPPAAAAVPPRSTQIVSFGTGFVEQVTVVRGGVGLPPALSPQAAAMAQRPDQNPATDSLTHGVRVLRGAAIRELFAIDLFGPANGGELDRIAFAVDGVESRHGADPAMWRPSLSGPQGPMQVSLAAALDVGGGDRFDIAQNRLLGRAYLAQMYRRYGNWADAVAAYNWGPGNMDLWIAGGRDTGRLPFDVARYVAHVLRDALIAAAR